MAIANPAQDALMDAAFAADLLMNKQGADLRYINRANRKKERQASQAALPASCGNPAEVAKDSDTAEKRLFDCVVEGRNDYRGSETRRARGERSAGADQRVPDPGDQPGRRIV